MRTIRLVTLTLGLALRAAAGDLPDSASSTLDIRPGRSGEDKSCSVWVSWRGDQVYRGAGGTTKVVDGMEIWVTGRPSREYKQIGYMIYFLPTEPMFKNCVDAPREPDSVRVAHQRNGDAVIPLGRTGNQIKYRVIKYLATDAVGDAAITDEGVSATFDNAAAVYPSPRMIASKPMAMDGVPPLAPFVPRELLKSGIGRNVVIKVCTGADGRLDRPTEVITTSGIAALDNAAIQWASVVTYRPQTIDGKPTPGCKQIRASF